MNPVALTHTERGQLHMRRCCLDRTNYSLKLNTRNNRWVNTVGSHRILMQINRKCTTDNKFIRSGIPLHILSFKHGTETFYHGRWRYKRTKVHNSKLFYELKFVDNGLLLQLVASGHKRYDIDDGEDKEAFGVDEFVDSGDLDLKSDGEKEWTSMLTHKNIVFQYEPITVLKNGDFNFEYSPDLWLPAYNLFIELKQNKRKPKHMEIEKCKLTAQKGFNICLELGSPDNFDAYYWPAGATEPSVFHGQSIYDILHQHQRPKTPKTPKTPTAPRTPRRPRAPRASRAPRRPRAPIRPRRLIPKRRSKRETKPVIRFSPS